MNLLGVPKSATPTITPKTSGQQPGCKSNTQTESRRFFWVEPYHWPFFFFFFLAMWFPFLVALGLFHTQVAAMIDPLPSALSEWTTPIKVYSLSSFKSRILGTHPSLRVASFENSAWQRKGANEVSSTIVGYHGWQDGEDCFLEKSVISFNKFGFFSHMIISLSPPILQLP